MKFYDNEIVKYYWADNDNQDGTYFNSYEKCIQIDNEEFDYTFDVELEERKWRAVLYLRLHNELLNNKAYQIAYNHIIDEYIRKFEYVVNGKHKIIITKEDRELQNFVIDIEIKTLGKRKISKYELDALYIVDLMQDLISNWFESQNRLSHSAVYNG